MKLLTVHFLLSTLFSNTLNLPAFLRARGKLEAKKNNR
jgi:hypothetical protein